MPEQLYNLTNLTEGENIAQQVITINQLSGELFGVMLLGSLMIILYLSLKASTQEKDEVIFTLTMWAGAMVSLMLQIIGIVGAGITLTIVTIAALGLGYTFIRNRQ